MLGLVATAAQAQQLVTARVLAAEPVMQQVPVSNCGGYGAQPSGAGAAMGALTGGLIGSQMGRGAGHAAGAVFGALAGAFLGNSVEAGQRAYGGCATRYENRITGYDVTYDVGGQSYRTRMAQAPGQWIQVPAPAYAYGNPDVQSYPVQPAPVATYPMPPAYSSYPAAGDAPVAYGGSYPYPQQQPVYPAPYPQAYPQAYPYPAPVYQAYPAPVYVQPAPRYVAPVGVNLSVGGVFGGRHRGGGWGIGVGSGY